MTVNAAVLNGNVGKDPEVKYLDSGTVIATFSIAVPLFKQGEKHTLWMDCKAFGKTAETIGEWVKQG